MSLNVTMNSGEGYPELSLDGTLHPKDSKTNTFVSLRLKRGDARITLYIEDHKELNLLAAECQKLARKLELQQAVDDTLITAPLVEIVSQVEAVTP